MTLAVNEFERTPLRRGQQALARGEWSAALEALYESVADTPGDAAAWEALGNACMWLQQTDGAIDARQRAYAIYREAGDDASSARVCLDLVWDYLEVRGEAAVANGWFQRARRLLEALPPAAEHALLGVFDAYMTLDEDPAAAETHARTAAALAERAGAGDIGTLALGLHGLALVTQGRVGEGMSLLDEAISAAISREITDPQWFYFTCCCMIDACDRVRDFGRSLEWCDQLHDFAERWQVQAFLTSCRVKYTGALLWRGEWDRLEDELTHVVRELGAERPSLAAGALVRLAELRRRQGRSEDALALLERVGSHALVAAVRMQLAADGGDDAAALDLARMLLRRTPASARTDRVLALEQQVRSASALGMHGDARAAAAELRRLGAAVPTPALRAAVCTAEAIVLAGEARYEPAATLLMEAVHLLEESGSPHEAATARIDLADVLRRLDRVQHARAELMLALRTLDATGAVVQASRARDLLARLEEAAEGEHDERPALTRRQREILALIADGLSDRDIAARLCLSEHTVHRHVSNIFMRLGVSTRTAAVARALRGELM